MRRGRPVDAGHFQMPRPTKPLYERLADLITEKVASGELKPGDRLPGELELSSALGVSRPSVREALKILRALGVLTIRRGNGVYVTCADPADIVRRLAPAPVSPPEGLHHAYEVRKALECQAAAWAAQRASEDQLAAMRRLVQEMKEVVENPEGDTPPPLDRLEQLDTAFHHTLMVATGNAVLIGLMESMMEMIIESRRYSLRVPGRAIQSVYDHERITQAVAARRPVAAARAMFAHIDGVQRSVFRTYGGEGKADGTCGAGLPQTAAGEAVDLLFFSGRGVLAGEEEPSRRGSGAEGG